MPNNKTIIRLVTPKGIAKYPWLNRPDTRFNPDGEYRVSLLIPVEEARPLMDQLEALVEEQYEKTIAELKEKGKIQDIRKVQKVDPFIEELDEEGNPTGNIEFKFKMKAKIKLKNGTIREVAPKIADAKGKWIEEELPIYGGSVLRINFTPSGYYMASNKTVGVTLYLNAVQVIELVTGGGSDPSDYGFAEEEGYVYESADAAFPENSEDTVEEDIDEDF